MKARDEDNLIDSLDEVDDPTGCTWSVYRGPLFIEFARPITYRVDGSNQDRPISAR